MEETLWISLAIIAAIAQAAFSLVNQFFKVNPVDLLWRMRLVAAMALLPFALSITWPTSPLFYIFVAIGSLLFAYSDLINFGLTATKGAGTVTRLQPLVVAITFVMWTILSPSLLISYIDSPLRAAGIILSITGSTYFALRLKKCSVTSDTLPQIAPALLLGALGIILGKLAMNHAPLMGGVVGYVFLQSLIVFASYMVVLNIPALKQRLIHKELTDRQDNGNGNSRIFWWAALCAAAAWLIHTPAKWGAISFVENPAYVTMIGLSAPLWIMMFYRLIKHKEEGDILSGLGIVACAAILIICTQF